MKTAFTLVELIFAIAIIGILAGLGYSSLKIDYSNKDAKHLLLKIKEARYHAMANETESALGCVSLDVSELQKNENESNQANPYTYRSKITFSPRPSLNTICFDAFGRPYGGISYNKDVMLMNRLFKVDINIKVAYYENSCSIRLYKFSGYGIILCN